jgi:hypothetical protein
VTTVGERGGGKRRGVERSAGQDILVPKVRVFSIFVPASSDY